MTCCVSNWILGSSISVLSPWKTNSLLFTSVLYLILHVRSQIPPLKWKLLFPHLTVVHFCVSCPCQLDTKGFVLLLMGWYIILLCILYGAFHSQLCKSVWAGWVGDNVIRWPGSKSKSSLQHHRATSWHFATSPTPERLYFSHFKLDCLFWWIKQKLILAMYLSLLIVDLNHLQSWES